MARLAPRLDCLLSLGRAARSLVLQDRLLALLLSFNGTDNPFCRCVGHLETQGACATSLIVWLRHCGRSYACGVARGSWLVLLSFLSLAGGACFDADYANKYLLTRVMDPSG